MDLVTPGIGLVFWTTIIFLTLLIVLGKVAWKPINNALIELIENFNPKDEAMQGTLDFCVKDYLRNNFDLAPGVAEKAAAKVMAEAEQKRDAMMVAAMADIKNQVLDLSIAVAEKVVRKQISTTPDQEMLVNDLVKEIKFN